MGGGSGKGWFKGTAGTLDIQEQIYQAYNDGKHNPEGDKFFKILVANKQGFLPFIGGGTYSVEIDKKDESYIEDNDGSVEDVFDLLIQVSDTENEPYVGNLNIIDSEDEEAVKGNTFEPPAKLSEK